MPIIRAAIKDLRKSQKRRKVNRSEKEKLKTALKDIKKLAAAKKMDEAMQRLPVVTSMIDKAVKHHLLHRNNAARKKSALAHLLAAK